MPRDLGLIREIQRDFKSHLIAFSPTHALDLLLTPELDINLEKIRGIAR
jgi:hypothetical protein